MIPNVDKVYTLDVSINTVAQNTRVFLPSFPSISKKTVRGIVISNYVTLSGQTDQIFLTLVNSKKDVLLYSFPCQDLSDNSFQFTFNTNPPQFFVRQFDLYDIETRASWINFAGLSGPVTGLLFKISFYI